MLKICCMISIVRGSSRQWCRTGRQKVIRLSCKIRVSRRWKSTISVDFLVFSGSSTEYCQKGFAGDDCGLIWTFRVLLCIPNMLIFTMSSIRGNTLGLSILNGLWSFQYLNYQFYTGAIAVKSNLDVLR